MLPRTGYNIPVRPIFAMFMTCGNLAYSGSKKKLETPVLKKYLAPVLKKSGSKRNFPVITFGFLQVSFGTPRPGTLFKNAKQLVKSITGKFFLELAANLENSGSKKNPDVKKIMTLRF